MAKFNRQIWKNIYFKLLCFDIIFFLVNGGFMALSDNIDTNGGYGLLEVGVILLAVDTVVAIVHGSVSYIKTQSILKSHLVFIISSLSCLGVLLTSLSEENKGASLLVTIRICIVFAFLSCCSAFITMIISKLKNHFAKSNKEDNKYQINKPDGDSTVTPIISKANQVTSNENKESSSSETIE